jgi:DNA-binding IclR family transcriptional regulator
VLAEISRTTGETAAFYVREGDQRIVLYRAHSDRPIRHHLEEGAATPLGRGAGAGCSPPSPTAPGEHAAKVRAERFYF